MQLWTEYEGVTIDGAFPLKKLLQPEGRSAFFSTANSKGDPAVMRLIECHFDEEEILARWRGVEAMGHPNFLKLDRYGQLSMDGSTVVYAVFEPVDANLSQVLEQGRLSFADTSQLAASLSAALEMLHTHGFVHEHMEPRNVFAVGDVVKLRSDCIREAPEGLAGVEAKQRDIHDFAVLLLQALTQQHSFDVSGKGPALPTPFDEIVRNGINGTWGLQEIRAALQSAQRSLRTRSTTTTASTRTPVDASKVSTSVPPSATSTMAEIPDPRRQERPTPMVREALLPETEKSEIPLRTRWIGAAGIVLFLALILGWFFLHERGDHTTPSKTVVPNSAQPRTAKARSSAPTPTRAAASTKPGAAGHDAAAGEQWRVVAYTYNHEDQAQKKSASLAQNHPDLKPEVFSPTGRAPYLVTIGGVMGRNEAYSLARTSRSAGLPRDTYAQNFK